MPAPVTGGVQLFPQLKSCNLAVDQRCTATPAEITVTLTWSKCLCRCFISNKINQVLSAPWGSWPICDAHYGLKKELQIHNRSYPIQQQQSHNHQTIVLCITKCHPPHISGFINRSFNAFPLPSPFPRLQLWFRSCGRFINRNSGHPASTIMSYSPSCWWRSFAAEWKLPIDTVRDTAVKLASSEENSGLRIKRKKECSYSN